MWANSITQLKNLLINEIYALFATKAENFKFFLPMFFFLQNNCPHHILLSTTFLIMKSLAQCRLDANSSHFQHLY